MRRSVPVAGAVLVLGPLVVLVLLVAPGRSAPETQAALTARFCPAR